MAVNPMLTIVNSAMNTTRTLNIVNTPMNGY